MVIAASTRRLLGNLFEYHDLGAVAAKGFNEPVHAFEVLRESGVESRFEAFHSSALTPLVGREEEIDCCCVAGRGQRTAKAKWCCYRESPALASRASPLPLWSGCKANCTRACATSARRITRQAPFTPSSVNLSMQPASSGTTRLNASWTGWRAARAGKPRYCAGYCPFGRSVVDPERQPLSPLDLSPQKRKEETLTAMLAQLEGLAARLPVLMIFEDAHWIDPTSLELLERIIDRIEDLPVLLIVTARPEFAPPWTGRPQVTVHPLNRLTRREGWR